MEPIFASTLKFLFQMKIKEKKLDEMCLSAMKSKRWVFYFENSDVCYNIKGNSALRLRLVTKLIAPRQQHQRKVGNNLPMVSFLTIGVVAFATV